MDRLSRIARLLRCYSLISTSRAGSGHPTSCLSAADLMAVLCFGGHFRYDTSDPSLPTNDRLIFSKGHAAPLYYALWVVAGAFPARELLSLRTLNSRAEGHPTKEFPYTEVPTGSLGMGLSVGLGMALAARMDNLPYRTYVLLGDGEMAEGSVWEALAVGAHYQLDNVVGIVDVNRLGQSSETMYGHDADSYARRIASFGWETIVVDGHDLSQIDHAFTHASTTKGRPTMIVARTIKGKGVLSLENREGKHGRAIPESDLPAVLNELGEIDTTLTATFAVPPTLPTQSITHVPRPQVDVKYALGQMVTTRQSYGETLLQLTMHDPRVLALDADLSNSTFTYLVKERNPTHYLDMYIAEQNMISLADGLSQRGKIPFVSTFASFVLRAHDQLRMASLGQTNIKVMGSHTGMTNSRDGASQMGLEDIALMRAIPDSTVLYPSDAVSMARLVVRAWEHVGLVYICGMREPTPVIYPPDEDFTIGGLKIHRDMSRPHTHVVVGAGATLHEALKAQSILLSRGISIAVVDLYSIKPLDGVNLRSLISDGQSTLVVEDHYPEGSIAEAVRTALADMPVIVRSLAVRKRPHSASPSELLTYEGIDADSIVDTITREDHRDVVK